MDCFSIEISFLCFVIVYFMFPSNVIFIKILIFYAINERKLGIPYFYANSNLCSTKNVEMKQIKPYTMQIKTVFIDRKRILGQIVFLQEILDNTANFR